MYGDAIDSQLQVALPQLDSALLTATFFLDGKADNRNAILWQQAAQKGNELANHTYYHPCLNAVSLSSKTSKQSMIAEISRMNDVLKNLDNK